MCGIIGIVGQRPVSDMLIEGLSRLEYRGYDSAGIATIENGAFRRIRAKGKLNNLRTKLAQTELNGVIGVGHTRWATHGIANERNAHPHVSGGCAVVHNGIIENFSKLKQQVINHGKVLQSDTDSEVVSHLVVIALEQGKTPEQAVAATLALLIGTFSLVFLFENNPDILIGARRGSPLVVGIGQKENYLASDAIALASLTNKLIYLDDGDWAVVKERSVIIYDKKNNRVERVETITNIPHNIISKDNYRHFMLKEIFEQPDAVAHTIANHVNLNEHKVILAQDLVKIANRINRVVITACGTAMFAGLVARYWIEKYANIPVEVDVASEFRYRAMPLTSSDLVIIISQSGETADTLGALRRCKRAGAFVLGVVNVPESSIARQADSVMLSAAWPEIGVASTKAFSCQLAVLAAIAIGLGQERRCLSDISLQIEELLSSSRGVSEALKLEGTIAEISSALTQAKRVIYIGRGTNYPLALEGALKLKELSYISAHGYAAGELKHGPIAMIDHQTISIVIAPYDEFFTKTISNMHEIIARKGKVILITNSVGIKLVGQDAWRSIVMPDSSGLATPIVTAVPIQLLAYHTAVHIGTDVDQPRNLAKSVTVE